MNIKSCIWVDNAQTLSHYRITESLRHPTIRVWNRTLCQGLYIPNDINIII